MPHPVVLPPRLSCPVRPVSRRTRSRIPTRSLIRSLLLLAPFFLFAVHHAFAAVRISEFMAQNDGGLRDADGDTPDWIEIQNNSATSVNLAGWHLTDNPTNFTKWTFPATEVPPGGFLLVFASAKDRALSGAELHTNFQLDQEGGYLALIAADGITVVHSFTYPNQRANVSFGIGSSNTVATLVASNSNARWLIPSDGALGLSWTSSNFNDSAWTSSSFPLRYDITVGAGTPLLSIDINARSADTSANTQSGFSSFIMGGASGIQSGPITRTYGSISVTLSNSSASFGYDDRVRGLPSNGGAFTLQNIFRDFIFSRDNSGTSGLDIYIAGLSPNQEYDFIVWSFDASSLGSRVSDWFANGVLVTNNYIFSGSVLPTDDSKDRFTFRTTANSSGAVLISGRRDTTSVNQNNAADLGVFLNGFQVAPVSTVPTTNGNVSAMAGNNASIYTRQPFVLNNPSFYDSLTLRVRYDDGFIAYLNGVEIARRNAPANPDFNSSATTTNNAAILEEIVLPGGASMLVEGANVLAIQGLNVSATDSDFLLQAELIAVRTTEFNPRFFSPPTPGAANAVGYLGLVADTKFTPNRGFYDAPFSLSITTATVAAEIRYTTNGSAPSPTNGFLFSAPISITANSFIRAAAFLPGYVPSDIDTHSYLFLRDILRQSNNIPNYPTLWQASYPADYAMDSNIVNHTIYGGTISNDLRSIPSLCIVSDHNGLWNSTTGIYPNSTSIGPAWERAASLELISGGGATEFAANCKIQIHGNASRDNVRTPKHSIGVSFSSDYGPTKLRYDWFGGGVDVQDKIVLRGCGFVDGWAGRYADDAIYTSTETGESFRGARYRPENTCYLRDVWVKDSFRAMGWTASRSQYVHLYLNGLYWGLYEPSEHLDASYFTLRYGGQEGAWDVVVGEDNNGPPVLVDGSLSDWQTVLNLANAGITTESAYQALAQLIDIDNLIDYMMLHVFSESEDWPRHNWYVAHRRATNGVPATKFICSVWDQELTLDRLVRRNRIDVGGSGGEVYSPARVYLQLRAWPEFRRQFGDRIQKHLFNGGALTPSNNVARLLAPAALIRNALVGESARWGDARKNPTPGNTFGTGQTFTRDEWWQPEIDKLATNFFQKLTADNVSRFRLGNLYPNLGAPEFNQFGGAVAAGFELNISHTNADGTIFFTLDGSDPREYGTAAVAASAQGYSAPIVLNSPTLVRARVQSAGQWSALVEAAFYPPQDLSKLSLTEIMYNPPVIAGTNGDEFEFIELKNAGTNTLNLSGLTFSGINFAFTNGTTLDPGAFFVLARNAAAFAAKYPGVVANGIYTGKLDNGGETLTLSHPLGATIFSVTYDDEAPWPGTPDNFGFSLVPKNPGATQAPDDAASWRASANPGGSPGGDDPSPSIPPILINEVLTASLSPAVDRIELFNPNAMDVDIGGWFLTDDHTTPKKYRITDGMSIPAGQFLVFDETQFNATPGTNGSFSLSSHGDSVYLFSGDANTNLTGYSHGFSFDGSPPGISFGRYVNSVGAEQFPAQLAQSFFAGNTGPRVGPVVINEIQYHPANGGDEFIELKNIATGSVQLFDPGAPANTWLLNGIGFTFPTNITLDPGAFLLLVATNPAAFRAKYSVPNNVAILGPYPGGLQHSGERLKLQRPGAPDTNGVPYISVDQVRYNDKAPWPPAADGSGYSLRRIDAAAYGDDPINWTAGPPTPGWPNDDQDNDGLPDSWEIANQTQPAVFDSADDPDHDGLTNLQEFLAGTNPQDSGSVLRFENVALLPNSIELQFLARSNRTYRVLVQQSLGQPDWTTHTNLSAATTNRSITISDSLTNTTRFYRLSIP